MYLQMRQKNWNEFWDLMLCEMAQLMCLSLPQLGRVFVSLNRESIVLNKIRACYL